jgi:hypothetical protein
MIELVPAESFRFVEEFIEPAFDQRPFRRHAPTERLAQSRQPSFDLGDQVSKGQVLATIEGSIGKALAISGLACLRRSRQITPASPSRIPAAAENAVRCCPVEG